MCMCVYKYVDIYWSALVPFSTLRTVEAECFFSFENELVHQTGSRGLAQDLRNSRALSAPLYWLQPPSLIIQKDFMCCLH